MDSVVDTNYLRNSELESLLQSTPTEDRFILTDTAILETLKNEHWETTARNSFKIVAQYPAKIWVARAPSELLRTELDTGRTTVGIIDVKLSTHFRNLLSELHSGTDGVYINSLRTQIVRAQADLAEKQQNHIDNLKELKDAYTSIKGCFDIQGYRRLPDSEKDSKRQSLIRSLGELGAKGALEALWQPWRFRRNLLGSPSAFLRINMGYFSLGFKWAILNGLDSFPSHKATNEIMDLAHAWVATYADCILSEENSVIKLRQEILDALRYTVPPV